MDLPRTPSEFAPRELLDAAEVARRLSIHVRTLYRLVRRGRAPQPIRLSRKLVRWRSRDIARYVRDLKRLTG
jgi:predicted DNA-binding transcriptional regulator AlpA